MLDQSDYDDGLTPRCDPSLALKFAIAGTIAAFIGLAFVIHTFT
ncbi:MULTISPECIES: hypothetical protein [unclassified Chelatococcus]|nr:MULTISPECIES: hypothetical protein [unclassified Chelatococcus]CAH1671675.1 hypothetical protein CHELA41_23570 [Hyphomicrobiales bacterium]CAH1676116.1 hypothetical protein CHELA20_51446 [Hyphomicrobiales bacterium]